MVFHQDQIILRAEKSKLMLSNVNYSLRGLAILLVILGHISSPLRDFIFSFHIPFLFFLSGFYLRDDLMFREMFLKNFKRLIIPFLIFGSLGILITYTKDVCLNRKIIPLNQSFLNLITWSDYNHMSHYGFVLWFLPALFWARILVSVIMKIIKNNVALFTLFLASLLPSSYLLLNYQFMWAIDESLAAFPWVLLGVIASKKIKTYPSGVMKYFFVLSLLLIFTLFLYGIQKIDIAQAYIKDPIIALLNCYLIIMITFNLFMYMFKNIELNILSVFTFFGKRSYFLMIFHPYSNNISSFFVTYLNYPNSWLIVFFMSIFLLILFNIFLSKIKLFSFLFLK